jgi:serine/threonine protein kinase
VVEDPQLESPPAPPQLPGYEFHGLLGVGGFAVVFGGERFSDRAAVACKVALGGDAAVCERFRREANALTSIGPPHVPALYESGVSPEGHPFIVMEKLLGESLACWVERRAARAQMPTLEEFLPIARGLLTALGATHERGFIHRDLKPDNVFWCGDRAVLLDFGVLRHNAPTEVELTRTGAVLGTPRYMSPEQIKGEEIDVRADIYAAASLLYELLALRPPFSGSQHEVERAHLFHIPPPLPEELAIPAALERVIHAGLAKLPQHRPASAANLLANIEQACGADADLSRRARGHQPVVLCFFEGGERSPAALQDAVNAHQGTLAGARGGGYVVAFTGGPDLLLRARRFGEELCAAGLTVAIHLDSLLVRERPGRPITIHGAAITRPESWRPTNAWGGILLTADAARAAPFVTTAVADRPGFYAFPPRKA